jgi:fucose permease
MRATFGRELDALGALLLASTIGYVISSFSSGRLLQRLNLGGVLAASCSLTATALGGYALAPYWWYLLPLAVLLGLGGGAIDAALNTYVAANHGPRTLNWLHACYGLGAALGPLVMTAVLEAGRPWQRGYAVVSLLQGGLAAAFMATLPRWPRTAGGDDGTQPAARIQDTLRLPVARLGILTFVVYAGVEASIGAWIYTLLTLGRDVDPATAGVVASTFWGGLTGGRLLAATLGARYAPTLMLRAALAAVLLGVAAVWLQLGTSVTIAGVGLAGLACGPIFPTLVALTPARVGGAHAGNAVGFQVAAAAVGLSVIPALVGLVADAVGVEAIASAFLLLAALLAGVHHWWDRSGVGAHRRPASASPPT